MNYSAEIIGVGTELLLGNTANTDAQDISQMLSALGINVFYHTVVGDNDARLHAAVDIAKSRADIIITTGGLGPTYDDMTKQTLAACFHKPLLFNEQEAQRIRDYFRDRLQGHKMTENNLQQALLPEGCTIFHNDWGTAPGCAFQAEGKHVLMLPGPPRECRAMFRHCAVPYLKALSEAEIVSHSIRIFGMGESAVEDKLRPLMERLENPTLAPYAKEGEVMLRLTAKCPTHAEAEALMTPVLQEVQDILGDVIYGVDVDSLEAQVLSLLQENGLTLATAESCTGGLVSKRLTDIPGASKVYLGGVVAYANTVKEKLLGVDKALLDSQGAVCADVAKAMAQGARLAVGADLGIDITGIAGLATAPTEKMAGLVYVAFSDGKDTFCRELHSGTDRGRTRIVAANSALDMVRRYISGLPL